MGVPSLEMTVLMVFPLLWTIFCFTLASRNILPPWPGKNFSHLALHIQSSPPVQAIRLPHIPHTLPHVTQLLPYGSPYNGARPYHATLFLDGVAFDLL